MSIPAVEVNQLSKRIGRITVLSPLDLVVPRGSILALIGHNGAGKSTLIKLLLNILKPTQGKAFVLGLPTTALSGEDFQRIGFVSETQEMPAWMTIGQFMTHLRPMYPRWNDVGLLESLKLPSERKIKHLSRGMRMKAALASVLAFKPELLLLDEPFSGLDPAVRAELIQTLLDRTHTESPSAQPTTIMISSHDLEEIESFASHLAFLHQGDLRFVDTMEGLLRRCREVTVRFESDCAKDEAMNLAEGCIAMETQGAMLRFVDTRVNVEEHEDAIRMLMPNALHVQSESMSLRSIFLAFTKQGRADWRHE